MENIVSSIELTISNTELNSAIHSYATGSNVMEDSPRIDDPVDETLRF